LDPDIDNGMKQIVTDVTENVHQSHQSHSFQHLFWEQQKKVISLTDSCSMKWHPLVIKWCGIYQMLVVLSYHHKEHYVAIHTMSMQLLAFLQRWISTFLM